MSSENRNPRDGTVIPFEPRARRTPRLSGCGPGARARARIGWDACDEALVAAATLSLDSESAAVKALVQQLDAGFVTAVRNILGCTGRVVVFGMGVSELVADKISSAMSETGTHSFFVHPLEAVDGELDMVARDDIALLVSDSGETPEILQLLPFLTRRCATVIALVACTHSSLARGCCVVLRAAVDEFGGANRATGLTRALAAIALGDALAMAVARERQRESA